MAALVAVASRYYSRRLSRFYSNMKSDRAIKVPVKQGVLVGRERQLPSGLEYRSFQGVPYAKPPLGDLRFRSPVPLERFETAELDCGKERGVAHQRDMLTQDTIGSENSLFLNVYAPKQAKGPLPVMVWIHGGGFWFGSGNSDYYFPAELLEQQVVVVTINYRLGALGFLSLPEAGIYGNAGLKDQRLALQWVHDNIASFNGDVNNVTIFGQSAGAASVHLHAYAKHANKLFHKAIMHSGTANGTWVMQLDPPQKTRQLAELIGADQATRNDPRKLLEFLHAASPADLLANTLALLTPEERRRDLPLPFGPVVEEAASPDSIVNAPIMQMLLDKERLAGMPMMIGYTSGEGIASIMKAKGKLEVIEQDLARFLPRDLFPDTNVPAAREAAEDLRRFYLNGESLSKKRLSNLVDIMSDLRFNMDAQHAAEIHVHRQSSAPLFFFRFDYVGARNMYKTICQGNNLPGACHGDELFYLFQMANDEASISEDDARVSEQMSRMWANFARDGKPSKEWTAVQKPRQGEPFHLDFMVIDRECKMQRNPDAERSEFWRGLYKKYSNSYQTFRSKL